MLVPDPRRLPGAEFLPVRWTIGRTRLFPFVEGFTTNGGLLPFLCDFGDAFVFDIGVWYNARGEIWCGCGTDIDNPTADSSNLKLKKLNKILNQLKILHM